MTKVIMIIDEHSNIMFDCMNHADDHDVCTIVSTLCNVLVEECFTLGKEPTTYHEGHVRIDLSEAPYPAIEVFRAVGKQLERVEHKYPDYVRIY